MVGPYSEKLHFIARDHYEKYLHILGMKMKEIFIFGQRSSGSKHVLFEFEIWKDIKGQMFKD